MKKRVGVLLVLMFLSVVAQAQQASWGLYANMGVAYQNSIATIVVSQTLSDYNFAFSSHGGADYLFLGPERFRALAELHYVGSRYRDQLSAVAGFQVKTGSVPNYLGLTAGYQFLKNYHKKDGVTFGLIDTMFIPLSIDEILPFAQVKVDVDLTAHFAIELTAGMRLNITNLKEKN